MVRRLLISLRMSLFDVLAKQQRTLQELLADTQTQAQAGQRELAHVTFQLASNKLIACMRAEHATVYPRLERDAGLREEVAQARREHEAIEHAINRLRVGGLSREAWKAELAGLVKLFEEHSDLEEFTLFPMAALTFTAEELAGIGEDFLMALAMSSTVADAAITYEMAQFEPPPQMIVRFKAA